MKNSTKKAALVIIAVCILAVMLCSCGSSLKKKLVGEWYDSSHTEPTFIFYNDGTYEQRNKYGTGRWSVIDEDILKLINYYGETITYENVKVENNQLNLDGWKLYDSIENAQKAE